MTPFSKLPAFVLIKSDGYAWAIQAKCICPFDQSRVKT